MTSLPNGLVLDPAESQVVVNQEFMPAVIVSDPVQVFPKTEQLAPLHVYSAELAASAFTEPSAEAFMPSFPTQVSSFPAPPAPMNVEVVNPAVQTQSPSAVIHGTAAAYGVGVTSSLESALGPAALLPARSRANTVGSVAPAPGILSTGEQPPQPSYPSPPPVHEPPSEVLENLSTQFFENLSQTAATRGHYLNSKAKIRDLLADLQTQLDHFNQLIDGVSDLSLAKDESLKGIMGQDYLTQQVEDRTRKRCASRTETERPIKALKKEPQDDMIPARPAPSSVTFVFNPVKPQQAQGSYLPSTVTTPPSAFAPTAPSLPPLRSAWSDNVVPTRHTHSLSTGSIASPAAAPYANFARSSSGPIGRMNRSGSLGGSFTHPFQANPLAKPSPVAHSTFSTSWTNTTPSKVSSIIPPEEDELDEDVPDEDDEEEFDDLRSSRHSDHSPPLETEAISHSKEYTSPTASSDIPQEYRHEVDRIFFEFLNKICCNLDATDSKGEPIHQTLMAKKMQRLDESKDFRPFKFRIAAFTSAFLDELARQGYPEEKIPMKKVRNYLWRQPHILRFNEEGKKAKSKGNHIWNIEAKKTCEGKWEFRPFVRKIVGNPPTSAYVGQLWQWTPRIWDPQASWDKVPVHYSSPSLPPWLSWKEDTLSGIPPPGSQACDVTVVAKFVLDGQEGQLQQAIHINIAAPSHAYDRPNTYTLPRSASEPTIFQPNASRAGSRIATPAPEEAKVVAVLASVVQNIQSVAQYQANTQSPELPEVEVLAKASHIASQSLSAVDKVLNFTSTGFKDHYLAGLAQGVVAEAAQSVIAINKIAANQPNPTDATAIRAVSVDKMTEVTSDALATAVQLAGPASDELQIINAAKTVIQTRTAEIQNSILQTPSPPLPNHYATPTCTTTAASRLQPVANSYPIPPLLVQNYV